MHDAHAKGAMLWSMGLLIAAPVVLVAVAAIWHLKSQASAPNAEEAAPDPRG